MDKKHTILLFVIIAIIHSTTNTMFVKYVLPYTAPKPQVQHITTSSSLYSHKKTIDDIYNDVINIGEPACSKAYITSGTCTTQACVRFAFTRVKNREIQQRASQTRFSYLYKILSETHEGKYQYQHILEEQHHIKILNEMDKLFNAEEQAIFNINLNSNTTEEEWEKYKKTFKLIAHKKRCLSHQIDITNSNPYSSNGKSFFPHRRYSKFDECLTQSAKSRMQLKQETIISQTKKTVSKDLLPLIGYHNTAWKNPDILIMYTPETPEKE
jgi:hypothetical protein